MTEFTETPTSGPGRSLVERWQQVLDRHHWLPFVLPFAVFILFGALEPKANPQPAESGAGQVSSRTGGSTELEASEVDVQTSSAWSYPWAYTLRFVATCAAILLVWPAWRLVSKEVSWFLAPAIGVAGGILWIGVCRLRAEDHLLESLGLSQWATFGDRPAFNPLETLGGMPIIMVAFIAIRLVGLTLIVPLIEEYFVRGFLMRFVQQPQWWKLELGNVNWPAALSVTAYGVLAHPAEPLAALLWFNLITLLFARTRRLWDCIVAHAVTNGMIGAYVLTIRDWTLW